MGVNLRVIMLFDRAYYTKASTTNIVLGLGRYYTLITLKLNYRL